MKTWTKEEALPIMQKAFQDGILSAQNGGSQCLYRSPQGPCIIGVLLDDETAERWDILNCLGSSISLKAVYSGSESGDVARNEVLDTFPELDWFQQVQNIHDAWVSFIAGCGSERIENTQHLRERDASYRTQMKEMLELS
jgi:hypothetical protein